MKDNAKLRTAIETEAHRLGFAHIGIARAKPAPFLDVYHEWIASGRHADMAYLAREDAVAKRGDPDLIMEGCQRIICLALPYQPPKTDLGEDRPGKGRISAYATTLDYHEIILGKLSQLEAFILARSNKDIRVKSYVDTGPILERSYAASAGIGTIGKNSNLLIQGAGSYIFLAEILTNLELPIDTPLKIDLCKTCRRCIEACPTHCIQPNRTIDASRCISYLTIENKGVIPDDLKDQIGNWVFGCDVCQMICPHNAQAPVEPLSLGKPLLPEFIEWRWPGRVGLPPWGRPCNQTPLARAKRSGILRNAAIVLGNQGYNKALPILKDALSRESDPSVLDACDWAIAKIKRLN